MTDSWVDYMAVFQNLPTPVLLLSPEFVMIDANAAYERISGHSREELRGLAVPDVFPDNPSEPGVSGSQDVGDSLRRAVATGEPDAMAVQRYDVEIPGADGEFEERYWCPVNAPVTGPDGQVSLIIHSVEEVSELIRKYVAAMAASA